MLIKALKGLCGSDDIIVCNKVRMGKINENIKNLDNCESLFNKLGEELKNKNDSNVEKIVKENIFYEDIPSVTIKKMINAYNNSCNGEFISKLKESYILRGEKGFYFAWMPIIIKGE